MAGNGGKPATRGDYQRWRGSDKPVRHVRKIDGQTVALHGSVAPMMPPKRYLCQQDQGSRKAARWGERRCNPQNPKQSARRKDQGKIAPNTPPDKPRTRSNEAPRTRQGTSQSTRKEPQKKRQSGPGSAHSGPGPASTSWRPEQGLERRRGEIPRASNEHATRGGGDRTPTSEEESPADVSSDLTGLSPLRPEEGNAFSESDDSEPVRRQGPNRSPSRSPSRASEGDVEEPESSDEQSHTSGGEEGLRRRTLASKSRSPSVPPAVAGKAPVLLKPKPKAPPEPTPTLQVQGTCGGGAASELSLGMMGIVYMKDTSIASLQDVATDLRACPAQVLLVTCDSGERAIQLAAYLGFPTDDVDPSTVKPRPRQKGKGRKPEERSGQTFLTQTYDGLLVAGRHGIVHTVDLKVGSKTSGGGKLLIAELSLNKPVSHQLRFAVAVWTPAVYSPEDPEREPAVAVPELSWDEVRDLFYLNAVRVLAGEFGTTVHPMVKHLRKRFMVNAAAWGLYGGTPEEKELVVAPSVMCVIGPVLKLEIDTSAKKYLEYHPRGDGEVMGRQLTPEDISIRSISDPNPQFVSSRDWTMDWPPMHQVKQKAPSPSWGFGRRLMTSGGWEKEGEFAQERPPRGQS